MSNKVISAAWQIRDDNSEDMYDHDISASWAYEVAVMPLVHHSDGSKTEGAWIKMPGYYAERVREHCNEGELMLLADPATLRAIATCLRRVADINELRREEIDREQEEDPTEAEPDYSVGGDGWCDLVNNTVRHLTEVVDNTTCQEPE